MRIPRPLAGIGIAAGFLMIELLFGAGNGLLFDGLFILGACALEREVDRSLPDFSRAAYYAGAGALAAGVAALDGRDWFPALGFAACCFTCWFLGFVFCDPAPPRRPS